MGRGTPTGTSGGNGNGSGGMSRKIRHHGKPGTTNFNASGANLAGAGVPIRLSATEVEDEDPQSQLNDWDRETWGASSFGGAGTDAMGRSLHHRRTGSGRSSQSSGARVSAGQTRLSIASSTSSHSRSPSEPLAEETPVPPSSQGNEYLQRSRGLQRGSSGSSSNSERENSFGGLAGIPESERFERPVDRIIKDSADDLRRRGSVDDRTTSMGGVRLFVANPDLSD